MPHFLELPVSLKTQVVSLQFKNVSLMNSEYLHLDFPRVPQTGATLNTVQVCLNPSITLNAGAGSSKNTA